MKVCSTLLIIKEIKIKRGTTLQTVGQPTCKLLIIPSVGDDGSKWNLYTADGNVNCFNQFGKLTAFLWLSLHIHPLRSCNSIPKYITNNLTYICSPKNIDNNFTAELCARTNNQNTKDHRVFIKRAQNINKNESIIVTHNQHG